MKTMMKMGAMLCLLALCITGEAQQYTSDYKPLIPTGYSSKVVLRVPYGKTDSTIGISYPGDEESISEEHTDPASARNMIVTGDRFYFIDATCNRIKVFRSPGTFVRVTKRFDNLGYCAVSEDGLLFVVWGGSLDRLSCLDKQGNILWTKSSHDLLPNKQLKSNGLVKRIEGIGWLEWTRLGLSVSLMGVDNNGKYVQKIAIVSKQGKVRNITTGDMVDSSGVSYQMTAERNKDSLRYGVLIARNRAGIVIRKVRPNLGRDSAHLLEGYSGAFRWHVDPVGGFAMDSSARSSSKSVPVGRFSSTLFNVLWRFDTNGKMREQWRFPGSIFASRASEAVIGQDGNVYHLRFAEDGIEVTKYVHSTSKGLLNK
ncbi:MAG: hypothetical protein ACYC0V_04925 [Armatimonadota bacterium]